MDCFGDVSGHFRSLIKHNCEVVVVGVVMGDKVAAASCPNKTVRNVQDIREAKWNDLTDVQKRRIFDCFSENDILDFGYALFTPDHLNTIEYNYLLHQDVSFPPSWDLALTGYAYGEILFEYGAPDERRVLFYLDQVASTPQTEAVIDHVTDYVNLTKPFICKSENVGGVQAADCFAGAVAEDYKRDTSWLDSLDSSRITEVTNSSLAKLEYDLSQADADTSRN